MALELIVLWEDGESSSLEHGETLVDELETLDDLAQAHHLRLLSSYADDRDIPDDFAGDPGELAAFLGPNPVWHTPAEASDQIRRLAEHSDGVAADGLRELATILRRDTRAFQLDVLL